jgi:hypothetical protein
MIKQTAGSLGGYTAFMRWRQFSLRSLLLATAIVAAGFYAVDAVPPVAWIIVAVVIAYFAASAAGGFVLAATFVGGQRLVRWLLKDRT